MRCQVQNPVYELGQYLMSVSSAEELSKNPLMEPGNDTKVGWWLVILKKIMFWCVIVLFLHLLLISFVRAS